MMHKTEQAERLYLEEVIQILKDTLAGIDEDVKSRAKELQKQKEFLYENKADMDHVEKVSFRQSINMSAMIGETAVAKKTRIMKLVDSPYFGRIDFNHTSKNTVSPIYIGLHSFVDEANNDNLVHDWRAPISSMFYDYELGEAEYLSPDGIVSGEILMKRQYRIRNGKMEFMLESSFNVHDDILQEELSKSSDDKMKNIVATIQRDQNAIIRNETSRVLIIQGVAGSGKTSIALHRVAFLLYRFKETLESKDLMILSPNKVFADYISNVLPELGEERLPEKSIEELANELLKNKYKFQSFFEQVTLLLEKNDSEFAERIRFKASFEFLNKLNQYLVHIGNNYFQAVDLVVKRNYVIPAWFVEERFQARHRIPLLNRFDAIVTDIEENVKIFYKYEITTEERNELRKEVSEMFKMTNIRKLYIDFYDWLEKPEMFKTAKHSRLEYADVFPLIYMKLHLEGSKTFNRVKHLLIDEMQDYTAVQYAVIAKLFNCKMTILGDANQSVNPYSSTRSEEISKVFPGSERVKLCKSYRSSFEITRFAQKISPNPELELIERHGEEPQILKFSTAAGEIDKIRELIQEFKSSGHRSLGIICKTNKQAEDLYNALEKYEENMHFITEKSSSFFFGITVSSAHLAKGLEFDRVIIPGVSAKNYNTIVDKSMLYIACTRAMHNLVLTYVKEKSGFL